MRIVGLLAVSLSCAACLVDAAPADEADPAVGEVQEPASKFTSPFHFHKAYVGVTQFVVPNNGAVTVTASASWRGPTRCRLPRYTIELVEIGIFGTRAGERTFPASGVTHTEAWTGLHAGKYSLSFQTSNDDVACELWGEVTVNVKP